MSGRPPRVDHLRDNFLADIVAAKSLATAARSLGGVHAQRRLHPKHVRRIVELAFLGVVAEWDEFVEQVFVRYLCGAGTTSGYSPQLSAGRARDIAHAYEIISQNVKYDPTKQYLSFHDASWTYKRAQFFFLGTTPFAAIHTHAQRLQDAVAIRNRVAHNSTKAKTDFKAVAVAYVNPGGTLLSQGYRAGDLLLTPASRHFGSGAIRSGWNYFEAFLDLYGRISAAVVP